MWSDELTSQLLADTENAGGIIDLDWLVEESAEVQFLIAAYWVWALKMSSGDILNFCHLS